MSSSIVHVPNVALHLWVHHVRMALDDKQHSQKFHDVNRIILAVTSVLFHFFLYFVYLSKHFSHLIILQNQQKYYSGSLYIL